MPLLLLLFRVYFLSIWCAARLSRVSQAGNPLPPLPAPSSSCRHCARQTTRHFSIGRGQDEQQQQQQQPALASTRLDLALVPSSASPAPAPAPAAASLVVALAAAAGSSSRIREKENLAYICHGRRKGGRGGRRKGGCTSRSYPIAQQKHLAHCSSQTAQVLPSLESAKYMFLAGNCKKS